MLQAQLIGRPPAADDEVVDATGTATNGDRVTVYRSELGPAEYTVVGTVHGPEAEVYFTDDEAALLSPRIDAAIVDAQPADVRAVSPTNLDVYSGSALSRFDPATQRDAEALVAAPSFLDWIRSLGMAPSWLAPSPSWWPLIIAAVAGLGLALVGAAAAARRASRVHPAEALRESGADRQRAEGSSTLRNRSSRLRRAPLKRPVAHSGAALGFASPGR